jgi:hypothetical protein
LFKPAPQTPPGEFFKPRGKKAGEGTRTLDNHVGNVVLYQLSYTRRNLRLLQSPDQHKHAESPDITIIMQHETTGSTGNRGRFLTQTLRQIMDDSFATSTDHTDISP